MTPVKETTLCPECRTPVGPSTGTDTYKHVIQCMHLPNEGVGRLLATHEGRNDERSRRIVAALAALAGKE